MAFQHVEGVSCVLTGAPIVFADTLASGKSLLEKMKRMELDVREEEVSCPPGTSRGTLISCPSSSSPPSRPYRDWSAPESSSEPLLPPRSTPLTPSSPLYLLSTSALEDFPPSSPPYDSVVVGLAPDRLTYPVLNEAFRLLAGESGIKDVPLIATHKALYVRSSDGALSLGPGELSFSTFQY